MKIKKGDIVYFISNGEKIYDKVSEIYYLDDNDNEYPVSILDYKLLFPSERHVAGIAGIIIEGEKYALTWVLLKKDHRKEKLERILDEN
jgi:hypothetical protein